MTDEERQDLADILNQVNRLQARLAKIVGDVDKPKRLRRTDNVVKASAWEPDDKTLGWIAKTFPGVPYTDALSNFVDYWDDQCVTKTPAQWGAMLRKNPVFAGKMWSHMRNSTAPKGDITIRARDVWKQIKDGTLVERAHVKDREALRYLIDQKYVRVIGTTLECTS